MNATRRRLLKFLPLAPTLPAVLSTLPQRVPQATLAASSYAAHVRAVISHIASVTKVVRFVPYTTPSTSASKGWLGYWEWVRDGHVAAWVGMNGVHHAPYVRMTEAQWWATGKHIVQTNVPIEDGAMYRGFTATLAKFAEFVL